MDNNSQKAAMYCVGDVASYPTSDLGFRTIARIPRQSAIDWLSRFGITNDTAPGTVVSDANGICIHNKVMVVVWTSHDAAYALYNHDGWYWIIQGPPTYTGAPRKNVLPESSEMAEDWI